MFRLPRPLLLALPALAMTACGGGSHATAAQGAGSAAATGPATAQTFTIHGTDRDQFDPGTVAAKVGTLTLTLSNGGVPHNLTFKDPALTSISTVSGAATKSAKLTFDKPGTFTFECTIHPGMVGKLIVS